MARCVFINVNGFLKDDGALEGCSGFLVLTPQEFAAHERAAAAVNEPFDYAYASGLWALSFTFVVGLYLVARSAGTILNTIRGRS